MDKSPNEWHLNRNSFQIALDGTHAKLAVGFALSSRMQPHLFAPVLAPVLQVSPIGTWLEPEYTCAEYGARIAQAIGEISKLPEPLRSAFTKGIESADNEVSSRRNGFDEHRWAMHGASIWDNEQECSQLQAHLVEASTYMSMIPGVEYKRRTIPTGSDCGVHIEGVGSIVLMQGANHVSSYFYLHRSSFFMDSYSDHMPVLEVSRSVWEKHCCAGKLCESSDGIASVQAFEHNGINYINDGQMFSKDFASCEGWTYRPLEDWDGTTYSYLKQVDAWEDGSLERGDRRGLVVRVNRKIVVIDGAAHFIDTKCRPAASKNTAKSQTADRQPTTETERQPGLF